MPFTGPLPPDLAATADEVIEIMINTAAREVTATGCDLAAAMENAWTRLAVETPAVWGLAVLRLGETDNEEMLAYATIMGGH
jgi:hypothetical protein